MPIVISSTKTSVETIQSQISEASGNSNSEDKYTKKKEVTVKKEDEDAKYNNINDEFIDYIKKIDKKNISSIGLNYLTNLNMIQATDEKYYTLNSLNSENTMSLNNLSISSFPFKNFDNSEISEVITNYYDLLEGKLPTEYNEIVIEVDSNNRINELLKK